MSRAHIPLRIRCLRMATLYETMLGMLLLGRGLSRPIDLSHRLDEARLLDDAHPN